MASVASDKPSLEQEGEREQQQPGDGDGDGHSTGDDEGNGATLDRSPSRANKLGTKKIAVIMVALCVCFANTDL